jgi:hypothetical protein
MPGQGLDDLHRGLAHRQSRDERMAERMEIGHSIRGIAIWDSGRLQIGLNDEIGVFGQFAKDGLSR